MGLPSCSVALTGAVGSSGPHGAWGLECTLCPLHYATPSLSLLGTVGPEISAFPVTNSSLATLRYPSTILSPCRCPGHTYVTGAYVQRMPLHWSFRSWKPHLILSLPQT